MIVHGRIGAEKPSRNSKRRAYPQRRETRGQDVQLKFGVFGEEQRPSKLSGGHLVPRKDQRHLA